jgi:hypothetical protein
LSRRKGVLGRFWSKISDFEAISAAGITSNAVENGVAVWELPGERGPNAEKS